MDKQQIEEKFKKDEFKDLLKKHRNSAVWDVVLFAIALLCMIIISFASVVEVNGEKFYKNYLQSFRVNYINLDTSKDSKKLMEGRSNSIKLVLEKACNQDDPVSKALAEDLAKCLVTDSVLCLIKDDTEFNARIEECAKKYAELHLSYDMVEYIKILLSETSFKPDGVGVFSVDLYGIFYWSLNSCCFFAILLWDTVCFMLSIIKLCFNKKYTQLMYKKRYTNYKENKGRIRGGIGSLSFLFYAVFIIFYLCSLSKTKYFKDPARIFISAVNISPLIYVMAGISTVVLILSVINIRRKKKLHEWMCIHS